VSAAQNCPVLSVNAGPPALIKIGAKVPAGFTVPAGAALWEGTGVDAPDVTTTAAAQDAVRARASVAPQATVVVPGPKSDPEAGAQLMTTGWTPPVEIGFAKVTAIGAPVGETTGEIVGQVRTGGPAVTLTTVLHEATCRNASAALQFTGVVPTGNNDPEAGVHVVVIGDVPPMTIALTFTGTMAPLGDVEKETEQDIDSGSGGA
jgi:hypothetical protein